MTSAGRSQNAPFESKEYSDSVVRQLIDTIKVVNEDKLLIIFKGGFQMEQPLTEYEGDEMYESILKCRPCYTPRRIHHAPTGISSAETLIFRFGAPTICSLLYLLIPSRSSA
jgi:hypothetical protein